MVSRLHLMALQLTIRRLKDNGPKIMIAVFALLCAILLHLLAVPAVFLGNVLLSLIYKNKVS